MRKFIRYYWISKYPFVTEKKLFKIITQKTTKHDELLCDLRESTLLFQKIIDSSPSDWDDTKHGDKIYDSIEAVRLMNVT